jgi:hypothetical protein
MERALDRGIDPDKVPWPASTGGGKACGNMLIFLARAGEAVD